MAAFDRRGDSPASQRLVRHVPCGDAGVTLSLCGGRGLACDRERAFRVGACACRSEHSSDGEKRLTLVAKKI